MTEKIVTQCSVDGCLKTAHCKGHCSMHYTRLVRYGDVHFARSVGGSKQTVVQRFWSKVALTADDSRCWEWQGVINNKGYGITTENQKRWYAHRYAWMLENGRNPVLNILHSCDNPRCVNVRHLREGTQQENMMEAARKGRCQGQSSLPLTVHDVPYIRQSIRQGKTTRALGTEFQVSYSTIQDINNGIHWLSRAYDGNSIII